ncbi:MULTISPECIES: hypothetical protein [unclassified Moorena]|uniref:hypothetical protein n=1 Tax=unclassified Moorena TaxID=2683338 RepID=UPI0013F939AF|nr:MULTISPECIES: hypothetical protein [unclassified Moorena]NEP29115.1 hypothetical protein [Moorena sp. SIO3I6]NEQ62432.1 hypothetical protein [Moorena sp. SIO4A1]
MGRGVWGVGDKKAMQLRNRGKPRQSASGLFAFAFGVAYGQASATPIVTVRQARLNQ